MTNLLNDASPDIANQVSLRDAAMATPKVSPTRKFRRRDGFPEEAWRVRWSTLTDAQAQNIRGIWEANGTARITTYRPPNEDDLRAFVIEDYGERFIRNQTTQIQMTLRAKRNSLVPGVLSALSGLGDIDAKALGATVVGYARMRMMVTGVVIRVMEVSGLTVLPEIQAGANGTNDDIMNAFTVIGLSSVNDVFVYQGGIGAIRVLGPGDTMRFEIVTQATATTLKLGVAIVGYAIP